MTRRAQIEAMLAADPHDGFLRYALSMEMASAGDPAGALAELQKLLADDPAYLAAYFQAAQLAAQLGQMEEAKKLLDLGVPRAQAAGDLHAAEEMQGLRASLG
ncbi:MAG TPA: tetratricopeptide repeat protein [Gemmatales bacterium]|nr:tetratricopeptide repeat protein [Gemmatales bacterium]HMP59806.1 tetratricopeptide repeat protein [Gemmatales bacterium]